MEDKQSQPLIVGILLAAGFSRRFGGQNKLMQPLPGGLTVAESAAKALINALPNAIAVVRAENETLTSRLQALGYTVVHCTSNAQAMADSLHLGVLTAQSDFPHSTGMVIALADMPFIQSATIRQVASHLQHAPIVQPSVNAQRGHPVGFASHLADELLKVQGDQGAREVLRAHQAEIVLLACDDVGILQDIDTPDDLPNLTDIA